MAANQRGTGFTNIQRVIGANTANRLGSTIASKVGDVANQTRSQLGQAQSQFQTKAEQEQQRLQQNAQQRDQTLQNLSGSNAPTEEEKNKFKELRSGESKGPSQLDNVYDIRNKAQDAQQIGSNLKSAGGQQSLLQRYAGGQQYTQGQQRLDQLLLGQTGGQQLGQAKRAVSGIGSELQRAETGASARSQGLINQAQQLKSDTLNKLGQGFSSLEALAEQQAQQENQRRLQEVDRVAELKAKIQQAQEAKNVRGLFGLPTETQNSGDSVSAQASARPSYALTADEMRKLGITDDTNFYEQSVDLTRLSNSLQDPESLKALANVKAQQALDEQQRNKYYALQDLAGNDVNGKFGLGRGKAYEEAIAFNPIDKASSLDAIMSNEDKIASERAALQARIEAQPLEIQNRLKNLFFTQYGSQGTTSRGEDLLRSQGLVMNSDRALDVLDSMLGNSAEGSGYKSIEDIMNSSPNQIDPSLVQDAIYRANQYLGPGKEEEAKRIGEIFAKTAVNSFRPDSKDIFDVAANNSNIATSVLQQSLDRAKNLQEQTKNARFRRISNLLGGQ